MSYQKYNYYGNYDEDSRKFSYSVQDIFKTQKDKEKQRLRIYESILSKCFKKIKESSIHEEFFCLFPLPEYLPGYPLYNMTQCVTFILNSLKDKGFHARYVDPFLIFISWTLPKPELRRAEKPMIEDRPQTSYQPSQVNNYKPVENKQSNQGFFYRRF